jgi:hypothetical protein
LTPRGSAGLSRVCPGLAEHAAGDADDDREQDRAEQVELRAHAGGRASVWDEGARRRESMPHNGAVIAEGGVEWS